MPTGCFTSLALPLLSDALSLLPVGIGVADRRGNYLTLVGGLSDVLGKRHSSLDPSEAARWSVYDAAGGKVAMKDWPSQRALRGETVLPGAHATYMDESGQERHFRIGAAPIDLPGSGAGYVFLLQDARDEEAALDQMQDHFQRHLPEIVLDTLRRSRDEPARPKDTPQVTAAALTNRERDVLRLFALGFSRKEIASRLGIAVKTADFYQAAGMRKIGLRNRNDIVQFAIGQGWMTARTDEAPARIARKA